jgi:hypothetical protein
MQHLLRIGLPPYYAYHWKAGNYAILKEYAGKYFEATESAFWFRPWVYVLLSFVLLMRAMKNLRKQSKF